MYFFICCFHYDNFNTDYLGDNENDTDYLGHHPPGYSNNRLFRHDNPSDTAPHDFGHHHLRKITESDNNDNFASYCPPNMRSQHYSKRKPYPYKTQQHQPPNVPIQDENDYFINIFKQAQVSHDYAVYMTSIESTVYFEDIICQQLWSKGKDQYIKQYYWPIAIPNAATFELFKKHFNSAMYIF